MADPMNPAGPLRGLEAEFELVRELGRGGSAVVYLAVERELGREVAIKTVHPVYAADPDAAARLVREARTLARLQHPNIVTFYGVRRLADGGLAMIMQYVRGERLKDRIRAVGPLPLDEAQRILLDVARALAHAHRHHVVHRDIKPENIYLDSDVGLARLSDFGIARLWDQDGSLTQAGLAIGTPAYMAPEQIDGGVLDARSDIYSLGLVAHEMLSGRRPWEGQNLYGIIYRQKHEALPPLAELRPDLPVELAAAIEKALAKSPDERWPDADSFLAALLPAATTAAAAADPAVMPPVVKEPASGPAPASSGEDDALTIPYRPAEIAAAGETEEALEEAAPALAVSAAGEDMLAEAERALAELQASTPPVRPWLRPRRGPLVGAAALLVLVAGGLGAMSFMHRRQAASTMKVAGAWQSHASLASKPAAVPAQATAAPVSPPQTAPPAAAARTQPTAVPPADATPVAPPLPARLAKRAAEETPRPFRPTSARKDQVVLPGPPAGGMQPVDTERRHEDTTSRLLAAPRILGAPVPPAADARPRPPEVVSEATAGTPLQVRDLEKGPVFTPFTVAPQLQNRAQVAAALAQEYPRLRKLGSPEGRVVVWLLLDENGAVHRTQLKESSGNHPLDEAALRLASRMQFSPALNRDQRVATWVSVPVDFVKP